MISAAAHTAGPCVCVYVSDDRGYECQERDGIFMIAFGDAASAIEWSCVLQLALLRLQWSDTLLKMPLGSEVMDADGALLFRGLRARIGVYQVRLGADAKHVLSAVIVIGGW